MAFFVSVSSMYLGTVIKDMKLGEVGWGLILGWSIWVLIFPIVIEFIEVNFDLKKGLLVFFNNLIIYNFNFFKF